MFDCSGKAFIKVYRKFLEWEWYDNNNVKILFLHCLLKANWKATKWHGITLEPGQFITSLNTLSEETQLSVRQVRVALDHLTMTGEVTSKCQSKYRIITVNNWDCYQGNDKVSDKQVTSKRQDDDKQVTTDKEYKEYKEREEVKNISPYNPPKGKPTYYPNDEKLNQAFVDYVAMRKKIKSPMTDRAVELAISKLEKLSGGDNDKAIAILEQSIMNSWKGLFELKDKSQTSVFDAWANA